MKKHLFIYAVLCMAMFMSSCVSSSSDEENNATGYVPDETNSDISDQEQGDLDSLSPDTGEEDHTQQSDSTTQPDAAEQPDTTPQQDTNPQPQPDNDPEPQPEPAVCGNGEREVGEACDGNKSCAEYSSGGMTGGEVVCASDCKSVDMSACTHSSKPYGYININVSFTNDPSNSEGATDPKMGIAPSTAEDFSIYMQKKANAVLGDDRDYAPIHGFYGVDENIEIPENNSATGDMASTTSQVNLLAVHYAEQQVITVDQVPYKIGANGGMNNLLLSPVVTVYFWDDDIVTGPMIVGFGNGPDVVLYEYPREADPNTNPKPCVLAVAYDVTDNFNVTYAMNTTASQGGEIAFQADHLPLYHPTDTPHGDLSEVLVGAWSQSVQPNTGPCPKE